MFHYDDLYFPWLEMIEAALRLQIADVDDVKMAHEKAMAEKERNFKKNDLPYDGC